MKTLRFVLMGLLITTMSTFTFSAKAADPELTINGVTLSWPEVIRKPTNLFDTVTMTLTNNSDDWLLGTGFEIRDRFGTIVGVGEGTRAPESDFWTPSGPKTVPIVWKAYKIDKAVAPYTLSFFVYPMLDHRTIPISIMIKIPFQALVEGPTPSPVPTIYLTNPADKELSALIKSKTSELNSLTSKLKKICAVKPKPKGC